MWYNGLVWEGIPKCLIHNIYNQLKTAVEERQALLIPTGPEDYPISWRNLHEIPEGRGTDFIHFGYIQSVIAEMLAWCEAQWSDDLRDTPSFTNIFWNPTEGRPLTIEDVWAVTPEYGGDDWVPGIAPQDFAVMDQLRKIIESLKFVCVRKPVTDASWQPGKRYNTSAADREGCWDEIVSSPDRMYDQPGAPRLIFKESRTVGSLTVPCEANKYTMYSYILPDPPDSGTMIDGSLVAARTTTWQFGNPLITTIPIAGSDGGSYEIDFTGKPTSGGSNWFKYYSKATTWLSQAYLSPFFFSLSTLPDDNPFTYVQEGWTNSVSFRPHGLNFIMEYSDFTYG